MCRLFLTLVLSLLAAAAPAQDRPRAILVLDGSGSMWGQIDGTAKITIAQEVVTGLLDTLPADQELGLTAYGHRRKGDCSDIETLVAPGPGTRTAIAEAVSGISPRGKTPMTDAVIAAAEALKYTEEKATVILVSDGIETCAPDPCAAARRLEETGVDFTAHVVGFDVANEPDALAQMQCLADETGGIFRTAANADELAAALAVVAEPEPEPILVSFVATEGPGGPRITEGLVWDLGRTADGPWLTQDVASDGVAAEVPPGSALYARVTRPEDGAIAERSVTAEAGLGLVALPLPELIRPVATSFRATLGEDGPAIDEGLVWTVTGPDGPVVEVRQDAAFRLDLWPGDYTTEVLRIADETTVTAEFFVEELDKTVTVVFPEIQRTASIEAPAEAPAGSAVPVAWRTDSETDDYITVARPEQPGAEHVGYSYTREGNPVEVTMPLVPGDYELRYVAQGDPDTVLARRAITVTPVTASLDAPATAAAGDAIAVGWDGPAYRNDYIALAEPGAAPNDSLSYSYTRHGDPAELTLPLATGRYEIRYVANGAPDMVLASQPLEVLDVSATLEAAPSAVAGSDHPVTWNGPDNQNDYIAVARPDADPGQYESYTYTRRGNPVEVKMPLEPGTYELRYVAKGSPDKVLASIPVTVTAPEVSLEAAPSAVAGSDHPVTWNGPDNQNDYIAVARPDADPGQYESYTYTRRGNPVEVKMPLEPGTYELRYVANGSPDKVLASMPVTVTAPEVSLEAAPAAVAGSDHPVTWDGPDNQNDYIAVARPDADPGQYEGYTYTRRGNPVEVKMPLEPGTYEIRYVANGQPDKVLASMPVTVTAPEVSLEAAPAAVAGSDHPVTWTGPDNQNDYISVAAPGDGPGRYESYTYTRRGNPVEVKMPLEPGTYELRYVANGSPDKVLASMPITVTAPEVALEAPATAPAGSLVDVTWTGPDNQNDYLAVAAPGSDAGRYAHYVYTRRGNPGELRMPIDPGTYEIRYVANGSPDKLLAAREITLTPVSATIEAAATAPAGGELTVTWEGPDYRNDYIAVSVPGETGYESYSYTRRGNPVQVTLPEAPGTYELRYVAKQGDTVLATRPVTVE